MKVVINKPPVFAECQKAFKIPYGTVWTYGNCIYNPDGILIPDHVIAHETVHGGQQKYDDTVAKLWWQRYMADPQFRLEQELEAYSQQYKFICGRIKDRNDRARNLHRLACDLSGGMYGNIIGYAEATRKILKKSDIHRKIKK